MQKRRVVAVDVDLTVVDTLTPWLNWFENITGRKPENKSGGYDLVPEMKKIIEESDRPPFDPFIFWRRPNLYDNLLPLDGSVQALQEFYDADYDIIFVSHCVPEHTQSKINFIDKYFPFHSGFIATDRKEFVNYDVFVDDKHEQVIRGCKRNPQALHFQFEQVSKGYVHHPHSCEHTHFVADNWQEITSFIRI